MNFRSFVIITKPANAEQENRAEIRQRGTKRHTALYFQQNIYFAGGEVFILITTTKHLQSMFFFFSSTLLCVSSLCLSSFLLTLRYMTGNGDEAFVNSKNVMCLN